VSALPVATRAEIARRLLDGRERLAVLVTDEFLRLHPDWVDRYGERARKHGVQDAIFHIDFLAGAVEAGASEPFEAYARWAAEMLHFRGIAPAFLSENLRQVGAHLRDVLSEDEHRFVGAIVAAGAAAAEAGQNATGGEKGEESVLVASRELFTAAVLKGRRQAATGIARQAFRDGHSTVEVYTRIFQESQYEIGRLWAENRISVAQEHLATAVTQFVIAQVYGDLPVSDLTRGNVVITGVEGELHQVGANLVSDVLESEGWDVRFLGTQMPHAGILDVIEEHEAACVGISATMLFSLPKVRILVDEVRQRHGDELRIIVGGAAFRHSPAAAREIGADGWAGDLQAAIEAFCDPED
jgi:MerR family transcriptional regulator, light-induced transcriptional regulator